MQAGRSREGAWIEVAPLIVTKPNLKGRSREGAWIEVDVLLNAATAKNGSLPRGSVD